MFAAPIFGGSRLANWIRGLLSVSGILAIAGLSGVVSGNMQLRSIGIIGYVGVFPLAAALLAVLFIRTTSTGELGPPTSRPSDDVTNVRVARELPVADALLIRRVIAQKRPFTPDTIANRLGGAEEAQLLSGACVPVVRPRYENDPRDRGTA